MKNAVLTVKVDEHIKKKAQDVAGSFGIPLSTLVNAYLTELAHTGQIHFAVSEPMTKEMERIIETAEAEIAAGETAGPFESADDAIDYLNKL
jgi:addiction module RelB/DinJ family antitoxin